MAKPAEIADAVAIVPVRNVTATVAFYKDFLGFEARFVAQDESFAAVTRGQAALHFLRSDDPRALAATANNISLHVWVHGLDQLYKELSPQLSELPNGRVRPPFDQPYGVREFHVKDPDGCLLMFAESD